MPRLIDADALMEDLKQSHDRLLKIYESLPFEVEKRVCSAEIATFNEIGLRIKAAPTIEAEPVRHGRYDAAGDCTNCGYPMPTDDRIDAIFEDEIRYCYNCGAKMDGGAEDGQN